MGDPITYNKPLPIPDEVSQPFFEGARQQKLLLQECVSCGAWIWPIKPLCDVCWSADLVWASASGKGTLYSFTLMHQVYHPGFEQEVPYNIAIVELAEGLLVTTNVVGCSNDELQIGMPLVVLFEKLTDEINLPKFKPDRKE